jgi:hypothetical protein
MDGLTGPHPVTGRTLSGGQEPEDYPLIMGCANPGNRFGRTPPYFGV